MNRRIAAMIGRYAWIHLRTPVRMFELFFWPFMELLVWGFFSVYLTQHLAGTPKLMASLLFALVFWDVLYRSQQSVSLAFMEELWSRNIMNLMISPLRTWEWVAASYIYGFLKTLIVCGFLMIMAIGLYALRLSDLGLYFVPLFFNLLLMGWALGLFTAGLLIRFGHAAEALIWGIPFLVQPFSAIFYPLSVYPAWLKPFCMTLPSTFVMEGMRQTILNGLFPWTHFLAALGMNLVYLVAAAAFYGWMLERGRVSGRLVRMTG